MKHKAGKMFIIIGMVLVLSALSLLAYNDLESRQAERAAQAVIPSIREAISQAESIPPEAAAPSEAQPEEPQLQEMTVVEIDGYGYIGYVSIPSLGLELPVMSEWDYDRLKLAPCRFHGSTGTHDLVIAAHNYTRHFSKLKKLQEGDTVLFTDMDGVQTSYLVAFVTTLMPQAVEEMTSGEYDLTLFTCTYGGKSRITVRCVAQDGAA